MRPQHALDLNLGSLNVILNSLQYKTMLASADYFAWMALRMKYVHL